MTNDPIKPVAWMHPEANWCDIDWQTIRKHCRNDGPMPVPLYGPEVLARAERAEALLAEFAEALKPFAAEAGVYDPPENDDDCAAWSADFPIGSLRRARAAITKIQEVRHADNG